MALQRVHQKSCYLTYNEGAAPTLRDYPPVNVVGAKAAVAGAITLTLTVDGTAGGDAVFTEEPIVTLSIVNAVTNAIDITIGCESVWSADLKTVTIKLVKGTNVPGLLGGASLVAANPRVKFKITGY